MQVLNHGSMCPTTGAASARYTRGSIEDGPGVIISRIGGANSPIFFSAPSLILSNLRFPPRGRPLALIARPPSESVPLDFVATGRCPQPPFCPLSFTNCDRGSFPCRRLVCVSGRFLAKLSSFDSLTVNSVHG